MRAGPSYGFCTVWREHIALPAVLSDGRVTPLTEIAGDAPPSVRELLPDWDRWCDAVEDGLAEGVPGAPAGDEMFAPPITEPSAIYCAGANYYEHLREMGAQAVDKAQLETFHFLTAPAAMTGHLGAVVRPEHCSYLDWEVELAVVIGTTMHACTTEEVMAGVAGYTVANDVSARDYVKRAHPALGIDWLRHKSATTLLPIGPALVPARLVDDPMDLALGLTVNGEVRQDSTTSDMIFSVAEQLVALNQNNPLLPGDIVLTGTPAGTAAGHQERYLEPGDVMVAEIAGIGRLQNTVY